MVLLQVLNSPKSSESCSEPRGTYINILKEKIAKIDKEIDELGIEYPEDELQMHIDKLHEYNEIKDTGQLLLGKIGKEMNEKYHLYRFCKQLNVFLSLQLRLRERQQR